jgi:hypothetical protein
MIQSTAQKKRQKKHQLPIYPASHKVGMRVPEGGSDCAKCEYVDGENCANPHFEKWNGSDLIPAPTNEYCCDFFEPAKPE